VKMKDLQQSLAAFELTPIQLIEMRFSFSMTKLSKVYAILMIDA